MKTYWITGARGFIGRHLSRRLASDGYRVAGLGHGAWPALEAAEWGLAYWLNGDVSASNLAKMHTELGKPEGIFHFAGGSSVGAALANPHEDFKRTVGSTSDLLEWIRQHSPDAPLIAVSSAAVYGAGHDGLIPEDARLTPYSPYGTHKLMMEELCRSYAVNFGLLIVLPRLFSVYGPELKKQLLWDTCNKLATQGEADLGGSGEELRDWTHVSDVVEAMVGLLSFADTTAPALNIATGQPVPVREVVAELARVWSPATPPRIEFSGQSRAGDPYSLCADVGRLSELGMSCATSVSDGVTEYVQWFREQKGWA